MSFLDLEFLGKVCMTSIMVGLKMEGKITKLRVSEAKGTVFNIDTTHFMTKIYTRKFFYQTISQKSIPPKNDFGRPNIYFWEENHLGSLTLFFWKKGAYNLFFAFSELESGKADMTQQRAKFGALFPLFTQDHATHLFLTKVPKVGVGSDKKKLGLPNLPHQGGGEQRGVPW